MEIRENAAQLAKGHTAEDRTEVLPLRAMHLDVIVNTEQRYKENKTLTKTTS